MLLKRFSNTFSAPIAAIPNLSLSSGQFPSALKHAVVSPILKKTTVDTDEPNSYRPVSNLPFLSKLLERAVFIELTDHLARHTLLPDRQSAYRQNYFTETALLGLRNDMLLAADEGHGTALVLLDLSAAFDTIDHDILLNLLNKSCGLTGPVLGWFSNYLWGAYPGRGDWQRSVTHYEHPFRRTPRLSSRWNALHDLHRLIAFRDGHRRRDDRRFLRRHSGPNQALPRPEHLFLAPAFQSSLSPLFMVP